MFMRKRYLMAALLASIYCHNRLTMQYSFTSNKIALSDI